MQEKIRIQRKREAIENGFTIINVVGAGLNPDNTTAICETLNGAWILS